MDLSGLRSLGGEVMAVGEDLGRNVSGVRSRLGPAGVTGLPAVAAAVAAAEGWAQALVGLSGSVRQAGQAVIQAAGNYQAADERAAARTGGR